MSKATHNYESEQASGERSDSPTAQSIRCFGDPDPQRAIDMIGAVLKEQFDALDANAQRTAHEVVERDLGPQGNSNFS